MKNILAIATAAALLSGFATSAHAADVTLSGDVTSSCAVTVPATATLTEDAMPATKISGTVDATVICNDTSKTLNVAQSTATASTFPSGTPSVKLTGGSGNFTGMTAASTKTITTVTPSAGDTATITASVDAGSGALLKSGTYTYVVSATITP